MLDKEIDLNALNVFLRAVETGSFAAAGRSLGMPSNTCSRRVHLLEEALGVRLVQRSTRKFSLSTAGHQFYAHSKAGMAQIVDALRSLPQADAPPSGHVAVAAPAAFFELVAPGLIGSFLQRHPKVSISVRVNSEGADVIESGVDVAFLPGRKLPDSSLIARQVASSQVVLVASPDYLARRGIPQCAQDLCDHDCLTYAGRKWQLLGANGYSMHEVVGRFDVDSGAVLRSVALTGLGIASLPFVLVHEQLRSGALVEVLANHRGEPVVFYAVYANRRNVPSAVTALIDLVESHLAQR
jgi:DNA-binding transcriptional LysR family regulator